ncbi:Hypothetical predicted protein, partial [Marmota monax]
GRIKRKDSDREGVTVTKRYRGVYSWARSPRGVTGGFLVVVVNPSLGGPLTPSRSSPGKKGT